MKENILFIITGIKIGGIETYLLRFLQFKKKQIKPIILIQNLDKDNLFYNDFINLEAKIIYLPIRFSPLSFFKLYSLLKREQINCVCDFRGDFSGISLMISWFANIKNRIVFYRESIHQFQPSFLKNCYIKTLNYLIKRFSTKILSNSSEAFNSFFSKNFIKKKYHKVIKNGVYSKDEFLIVDDVRNFYGIPADAFVIGHVGRYSWAKNHDLIINVAKILCKKYDNCYFLLCGVGVKSAILPKLNKYNLHNKIITPGLCMDIPSHLNAMNVFLFPSYNEGQPNALIEAMITGIPIVASNIPSIIETIRNDMSNVLCDPNAVLDFVSQIEAIKKGDLPYNVEELKRWSRIEYSQKRRFNEFYKELL